MAIHIKNRWHNLDAQHSLEEIAGALAFNGWRIAKDRALNLHGERFIYETDRQRLAVIYEYLYFQVHILDRLASTIIDEAQRRVLLVQLAIKLAEFIQDNGLDLFGPGNYGRGFIDGLNQRSSEYGEFGFTENAGPSYPMLRHLGYQIQQIMGQQEQNRWVIDQVMDKDGGDTYKQIQRTLVGLIS